MPIRTPPLREATEQTLREMIERELREEQTLDFKQELALHDSGKLDLIQDVTAMANATGGAILYGAVAGEGDDRGQIVGLKGMRVR
jgi:hypothetical protein